jgi:hypothetical protein
MNKLSPYFLRRERALKRGEEQVEDPGGHPIFSQVGFLGSCL